MPPGMREKQRLEIYELLVEALGETEKARSLTTSIEKVVIEKQALRNRITASSIGKEIENSRNQLARTFRTALQEQKSHFIKWLLVIVACIMFLILWLHRPF